MKNFSKSNEALRKMTQALAELLQNTGWANFTDDQLRNELDKGNEMAELILRSRAVLKQDLDEAEAHCAQCAHEWPIKDGQTDINGYCNQCGLSFQWFINGYDCEENQMTPTTPTPALADLDLDLDELRALCDAVKRPWYGTLQIADGVTDDDAVAFIEAFSPDTVSDLIALARRAAQPAEGAGQVGQVAKGPDQQQIEWGNDLQGRLIDLSQDMTESEDARQVMAEAACLLASLTGHAVSQ